MTTDSELQDVFITAQLTVPKPYPDDTAEDMQAIDEWVRYHDARQLAGLRAIAEKAWDDGYRICNQEWMETTDLVTPDEYRTDSTNPFRSVPKEQQ